MLTTIVVTCSQTSSWWKGSGITSHDRRFVLWLRMGTNRRALAVGCARSSDNILDGGIVENGRRGTSFVTARREK